MVFDEDNEVEHGCKAVACSKPARCKSDASFSVHIERHQHIPSSAMEKLTNMNLTIELQNEPPLGVKAVSRLS